MGYSFYYPPENKVIVARNAEFLENSLIDQEASRSLEDLEIIQEEDTHPSLDTRLNHEEEDLEIDEPQSDIIPIRRSTRTRHAPDRMCLYIDAKEHELGDLGEPANYKAALLDPDKWLFKKKTDMDGNETFSPVADIRAIRILIAIAAYYDYEIWQMDVKTAILNGYLNEELQLSTHLNKGVFEMLMEVRSRAAMQAGIDKLAGAVDLTLRPIASSGLIIYRLIGVIFGDIKTQATMKKNYGDFGSDLAYLFNNKINKHPPHPNITNKYPVKTIGRTAGVTDNQKRGIKPMAKSIPTTQTSTDKEASGFGGLVAARIDHKDKGKSMAMLVAAGIDHKYEKGFTAI
nr:hypothetical protein [Tanacetum cinerariifolium]